MFSTHQLQQGTFWLVLRKSFFYSGDDQTLVQADQRAGGMSVLGDTQISTGHSPEEPALPLKATLAQAGAGRGNFGVLSSHNSSVMLWFVTCKNILPLEKSF